EVERVIISADPAGGKGAGGKRPPPFRPVARLTLLCLCPMLARGDLSDQAAPSPSRSAVCRPATRRVSLAGMSGVRSAVRAQPHDQRDVAVMVSTDLGACEWFVWDLRRSNLIDRGQLDQIVGEFLNRNPGAEPPALAEFLVSQSILTQFQAERLLQGKTHGFVLRPFPLMDPLGTGSMGPVYKALSKTDNHWSAVKVLPRRSMWNVRIARRKVREFEQCAHPTIVPFVDVGTSGGMHYL